MTWRDGRLAARPLFEALAALGVCPQHQRYVNLFEDDGPLTARPAALRAARRALKEGLAVVALGRRVQRELSGRGVPHVGLVHPAARGSIRRRQRYAEHVRQCLGPLLFGGEFYPPASPERRV